MAKLPVLYLSCDRGAFSGSIRQPRLRRLIKRDMSVGSVAYITSRKEAEQPEIFYQFENGVLAERLQSLMAERGFDVAIAGSRDLALEVLAESIIGVVPEEVIELRLNTGMTSDSYRQIGGCLEALRDQGVLLICMDQKGVGEGAVTHHQPHDAYIRDLIQQWEHEQLWLQAMSVSGLADHRDPPVKDKTVVDPTLCVLNTAFSLGGFKAPQRVFGFALNEDSQSLAGYGWMQ